MKRKKTVIIAEAGVNHNGSFVIAKKLVDKAAQSGADIIKFQTFKASNVVTKKSPKADYMKKKTGYKNQYEVLKKLELKNEEFIKLKHYCVRKKIEFLSSGFDEESLYFLKRLGQKRFKIPSGEINNLPYLKIISKFNSDIILSTGMSNLKEISNAIKILTKNGTPQKKIVVLHCNSEYPTPFEDVNLKAINNIKKHLNIRIGYSDHTSGIEVPIAAVSLGAEVIEKHLTLNKKMKGPDHSASLEPHEFSKMVKSIRNIEKSIGSGMKKPSRSEIKNRLIVRKSLVAKKAIKKGEKFNILNLTVKRPGTGISPMKFENFLGKKSPKDYKKDELI